MTSHGDETGLDVMDATIVAAQVGRAPRSPWRVAVRCGHNRPRVIATPPSLVDGTPFPTLFWLSCPWLVEGISRIESDGGVAQSAARLAADPDLAGRMARADATYRSLRSQEARGDDPCASVGIAGLRDSLKTKCLHAHAAAFLAGIDDPVGEEVLSHLNLDCPDDACAKYLSSPQAEEIS